jgi:hypothetical protein
MKLIARPGMSSMLVMSPKLSMTALPFTAMCEFA